MKKLTEEQKIEIEKALNGRLGTPDKPLICPMCSHNEFTITDGYFMRILQSHVKKLEYDGLSVPTISIICNNCGFVSQHAMGVLGLLPKDSRLHFLKLLTGQEKTKPRVSRDSPE